MRNTSRFKYLNQRINIEPDKKMMFHRMKEDTIEDFNKAWELGATDTYLNSLYRKTKQDLSEFNRELGLLPQDGMSRLKWSPVTKEDYEAVLKESVTNG